MDFNELTVSIEKVHHLFAKQAKNSINIFVTLRNWLLGFYIQEYELLGQDRSLYGEGLLEKLAEKLQEKQIPSTSYRTLRQYKQFYQQYPAFRQIASSKLKESTISTAPQIWQTLSAKLIQEPNTSFLSPEELIKSLSFSHFVELMKIEDPLKRNFYEFECINGAWATRDLKRQINSLYYERTALSKDKTKLTNIVRQNILQQTTADVIRDPYVFEFLGLNYKEVIYEDDLVKALLDKIQEFLLELGRGFCFEARNKRILIGDTHYKVDLVLYHRILKCHILLEMKIDSFNHENIGQLKTYLNYYKKHEMTPGDNPPVGILLCTEKDHALVEYALGDEKEQQLFVSQYQLKLPTKEEIKEFLEKELKEKNIESHSSKG